jgi:hypothetical protein
LKRRHNAGCIVRILDWLSIDRQQFIAVIKAGMIARSVALHT